MAKIFFSFSFLCCNIFYACSLITLLFIIYKYLKKKVSHFLKLKIAYINMNQLELWAIMYNRIMIYLTQSKSHEIV